MIPWKDVEPDVRIPDSSLLLKKMDFIAGIKLINLSQLNQRIFITSTCEKDINEHLSSSTTELGGLLAGFPFYINYVNDNDYKFISIISRAIPSQDFKSSSVSLRMGTDVWSATSQLISQGMVIIGWYHSHPDLGAFFSGTDRATQTAFFDKQYSLGLVIDPVRKQRKCFWGPQSVEVLSDIKGVDDGMALAASL